jgi:hypothetical protein
MKVENLLYSVSVLFFAILALAMFGWGFSFMWDFKISSHEGKTFSGLDYFVIRACAGLIFVGFVSGIYKLLDLFVFCMKQDLYKGD